MNQLARAHIRFDHFLFSESHFRHTFMCVDFALRMALINGKNYVRLTANCCHLSGRSGRQTNERMDLFFMLQSKRQKSQSEIEQAACCFAIENRDLI